jgi:hypothetical protein
MSMRGSPIFLAASIALAFAAGPAIAAGPETSVHSPEVVAPTDPRVGDTRTLDAPLGVEDLLGMTVVGAEGIRVGTVDDVLVGPDGQPAQVVVQVDGKKRVALDAARVDLGSTDDLRIADLTSAEVEAAADAGPAAARDPAIMAVDRRRAPTPEPKPVPPTQR